MESSRRDLLEGMAVDRFIFKNNQIKDLPQFYLTQNWYGTT